MKTLEQYLVEEAIRIAAGSGAYVNKSDKRSSTSYVFTYLPKHQVSEKVLKKLRGLLKGTAFRVKLQGRGGMNGTKYRGACRSCSFVPLAEATRADVYIYRK